MRENYEIRADARKILTNNWIPAILACVIFGAISFAIGSIPVVGFIIGIAVTGPLMLGLVSFFMNYSIKKSNDLNVLFSGFKENMINAILLQVISSIFILLWSLLLFIPGIIAAMSYSQAFYILRDNPKMEVLEAIKKSKEMMNGKKWKFFCLQFSFLGWAILSALTFGIGLLFLAPYISTSCALFYQDLSKNNESQKV